MAIANTGLPTNTPLRPIYDTDPNPVAFSNEILGGIHLIETRSLGGSPPQLFWQINVSRRQFGMLVYVNDEEKYYQLINRYQNLENPLEDPNNFIEFQLGSGSNEWLDSIKGSYNSPSDVPSALRVVGNKFLVKTPGTGDWVGYSNKIATYAIDPDGATTYTYEDVEDGATLRIDNDPNSIYWFSGTNSTTGRWNREIQNTVRYIYPTSNNGLTFSYTTQEQTRITGYTYCVFYANFGTANSGTVSLSIDGGVYTPIKKVSSNTLTDLSANDFGAGVEYQLTFDSGVFQIALPGAGSGGTIGIAEDGDYTDGLYTDFTENTLIGVPIDRFNQILKALVPPPAPNLSSWSVTNQSEFVSGGISYIFSYATNTLGYVTTAGSQFAQSTRGDIFVKNLYGGYRLGITDATGTITGDLNSGVTKNTNLPIAAYESKAIGNGITGSIYLYVNSITASSVDLGSTIGAITSPPNSSGSLVLTAATNSKFSNGTPFEFFWWRTGSYTVEKGGPYINKGFNTIQVKHILPNTTYTLTNYEFLLDDNTTTTQLVPQTTNYGLSNPLFISGIQYYTQGYIRYNVRANNIYRNTYYSGADAGTFLEQTTDTQSKSAIYNTATYDTNSNGSNNAFTPSPGEEALSVPNDPTDSFDFSTDFNVASGVRKINGGATFRLRAKRTVQSEVTDGTVTISNLFIDTVLTQGAAPTLLQENFNRETYRLPNSTGYNTVTQVTSGVWDSQISLLSTYTNALQVADGRLLYPYFNFNTATTDTNPNSGQVSRNYNSCKTTVTGAIYGGVTGHYRTYTRYFNVGSKSSPGFTMNMSWGFTNFVPVGSALSNNTDCYLEFKLPWNGTSDLSSKGGLIGGAVTGWLDASKNINGTVLPTDGQGCRGQTNNPSTGGNWVIDFGDRETAFSNGYIVMRITAGKDWTGYIEGITILPK